MNQNRRKLREIALQAMYAAEVSGDELNHILGTTIQQPTYHDLDGNGDDTNTENNSNASGQSKSGNTSENDMSVGSQARREALKSGELDKKGYQTNFAEKLFLRTQRNLKELDAIIEDQISNWDMERLALIDRQILRIALCELLYFEDIPTKVSINEAIEIAKHYSTSKSGKFINGILDAAYNKLNEEGRIEKSGRGLVDNSNS